ncbi:hypothetical protein ABZ442_05040 [Streptomyces triculaminicus]|uniref:hypothetical protein n=1 Tax=Streptomyces triculaminicus TaxID=2816232 RepID=UPI0033D69AB8
MPELLVAAISLAAGYTLGRAQLLDRLEDWVWRRFTRGGSWVHTRRGQLLTLAAHAIVRPAATARAWRHRHNPPEPPPTPVISRDLTRQETDQ